MILADKIINERKKNGWSQEELADMLSVSRQSVSKWESAQSVPDLNRILQLAEIFNVSTDYLLKDEIGTEDRLEYTTSDSRNDSPLYKLSLEEVNDYLAVKKETAPKIACGVTLCILSPALLILLAGFSEAGKFLSENAAAGIGIVTLLILVAIAVFIFIVEGSKVNKFKHLVEEPFETEYGVDGYIKELQAGYHNKLTYSIAVGVTLCILAVVPVMVSTMMEAPDIISVSLAAFLFVAVAAGVNIFVRVGSISEAYKIILQAEDYSAESKIQGKKIAPIMNIYWILVLTIYLGISFYTFAWSYTWIIWPVAGVLSAAISAILKATIGSR